jgi:predicted amidophosphoribosyltransferase
MTKPTTTGRKTKAYIKVKMCMNCLREINACKCEKKVIALAKECSNCGEWLDEFDNFCSQCGAKIL